MNERNIFKHLEKWVVYAIYILLIIASLNTCNSCRSNKEDLRSLEKELDSTNLILQAFMDSSASKYDIVKDNDKQMAKFLYWEREADKPQYKNYTPKDYEKLIKEK
jgi:hypothetical protein